MFKRKMTALFLALAMCLSLSMANAFATESSLETSHPEIDFNGPMVFYPFVYTEEAGWAWARELIGDCSSCVPGYLYLQDLTTKEITQIIEDPVDMFCPDREILYCIVNGNSVVRTNYWGENKTLLYTAQYGNLANLEHWADSLLFSDGEHVIRFDLMTSCWEDLGVFEGITDIYLEEDNSFVWVNSEGVEYARQADGHDAVVYLPEDGLSEHEEYCEMHEDFEYSNANGITPFAVMVPVIFPLSNYPAGSHFVKKTSVTCTCHGLDYCSTPSHASYSENCNCGYYKGGYQCEGFARYAMDQYAHYAPSSASWYPLRGDHDVASNVTVTSADDVRLFFQATPSVGYGTYVRVKRSSGTHALVIGEITSRGITVYDANFSNSDPCVVLFKTYSYEKFYSNMTIKDSIVRVVAPPFNGTTEKANSKYHKAYCSIGDCGGYTFLEHASTAPGKNVTCKYCGYIGEIWNIAPLTN